MIEGITDKQALFNHVATHLIKQGRRSVRNGQCAYRGNDGTRCAAGCLIDDAQYTAEMEGRSVFAQDILPCINASIGREIGGTDLCMARGSRWGSLPTDLEIKMLQKMQVIHDGIDVDAWPEHLRAIAVEFGLQLPDCLKETA
jgi:hypothetical protein